MQKPLISIVVPTRDRPDTLEITLRSLALHTSNRIEIVVQDNMSGQDTVDIVTRAAQRDSRIRYFRAPHPTSQRQSFEFGLREATGDYLSIIGDDDGFCLGSLDWLVAQLETHRVDAVRWNLVSYIWPSLSTDKAGFVFLHPVHCFGDSLIVRAEPLITAALEAKVNGSWDNILVYHGMISRRIYDKMRQMTGGEFFAYPMPDVYAHNLLPLICDKILQVNDIVSIYGQSGHSAGASWTRALDKADVGAAEGNRWMAESIADPVAAGVAWQPDIRTLRYHDFAAFKVAESYGMLAGRNLDPQLWIKAILEEIRASPWQLAAWRTAVAKAPYDSEIFAAVHAEFEHFVLTDTAKPDRMVTVDPDAPVLRIGIVDQSLNDDVEGASLAIERVTSVSAPRYRPVSRRGALGGWVAAYMKKRNLSVQRHAPVMIRRLVKSKSMRRFLRRFIQISEMSVDARQAQLLERLNNLHRTALDQRATGATDRRKPVVSVH